MQGLCGNYNDNEGDDFKLPTGGGAILSALEFGDAWRLDSTCPKGKEVIVSLKYGLIKFILTHHWNIISQIFLWDFLNLKNLYTEDRRRRRSTQNFYTVFKFPY